jgi:hypothetical protein
MPVKEPAQLAAVREFVRQLGIEPLVEQAKELAEAHFPKPHQVELELSRDPDEGERWLVVRVWVRGEAGLLREAYRRCLREWVRKTPPVRRNLVRLSYVAS